MDSPPPPPIFEPVSSEQAGAEDKDDEVAVGDLGQGEKNQRLDENGNFLEGEEEEEVEEEEEEEEEEESEGAQDDEEVVEEEEQEEAEGDDDDEEQVEQGQGDNAVECADEAGEALGGDELVVEAQGSPKGSSKGDGIWRREANTRLITVAKFLQKIARKHWERKFKDAARRRSAVREEILEKLKAAGYAAEEPDAKGEAAPDGKPSQAQSAAATGKADDNEDPEDLLPINLDAQPRESYLGQTLLPPRVLLELRSLLHKAPSGPCARRLDETRQLAALLLATKGFQKALRKLPGRAALRVAQNLVASRLDINDPVLRLDPSSTELSTEGVDTAAPHIGGPDAVSLILAGEASLELLGAPGVLQATELVPGCQVVPGYLSMKRIPSGWLQTDPSIRLQCRCKVEVEVVRLPLSLIQAAIEQESMTEALRCEARLALSACPPWSRGKEEVAALVEYLNFHVECFTGLPTQQMEEVCQALELQHASAGEELCRVGDTSVGLRILLRGKCAMFFPEGLFNSEGPPDQANHRGGDSRADKANMNDKKSQASRAMPLSELCEDDAMLEFQLCMPHGHRSLLEVKAMTDCDIIFVRKSTYNRHLAAIRKEPCLRLGSSYSLLFNAKARQNLAQAESILEGALRQHASLVEQAKQRQEQQTAQAQARGGGGRQLVLALQDAEAPSADAASSNSPTFLTSEGASEQRAPAVVELRRQGSGLSAKELASMTTLSKTSTSSKPGVFDLDSSAWNARSEVAARHAVNLAKGGVEQARHMVLSSLTSLLIKERGDSSSDSLRRGEEGTRELFQLLPLAAQRCLCGHAKIWRAAPGEVLFREGDASTSLLVLIQGEVALLKQTTSGPHVASEVADAQGHPHNAFGMSPDPTESSRQGSQELGSGIASGSPSASASPGANASVSDDNEEGEGTQQEEASEQAEASDARDESPDADQQEHEQAEEEGEGEEEDDQEEDEEEDEAEETNPDEDVSEQPSGSAGSSSAQAQEGGQGLGLGLGLGQSPSAASPEESQDNEEREEEEEQEEELEEEQEGGEAEDQMPAEVLKHMPAVAVAALFRHGVPVDEDSVLWLDSVAATCGVLPRHRVEMAAEISQEEYDELTVPLELLPTELAGYRLATSILDVIARRWKGLPVPWSGNYPPMTTARSFIRSSKLEWELLGLDIQVPERDPNAGLHEETTYDTHNLGSIDTAVRPGEALDDATPGAPGRSPDRLHTAVAVGAQTDILVFEEEALRKALEEVMPEKLLHTSCLAAESLRGCSASPSTAGLLSSQGSSRHLLERDSIDMLRTLDAILTCHDTFTNLDVRGRRFVARNASLIEVPAGDIVFRQGDEAKGYYQVLTGAVQLWKEALKAQELKSFGSSSSLGRSTTPAVHEALALRGKERRLMLQAGIGFAYGEPTLLGQVDVLQHTMEAEVDSCLLFVPKEIYQEAALDLDGWQIIRRRAITSSRLLKGPPVLDMTNLANLPTGLSSEKGVRCLASFPGRRAKDLETTLKKLSNNGKGPKLSCACVFLGDEAAGLGKHAKDPDSPDGACYCKALYGDLDCLLAGYILFNRVRNSKDQFDIVHKRARIMKAVFVDDLAPDVERRRAESFARQHWEASGRVAAWGCQWFADWKANIEKALALHQRLVVCRPLGASPLERMHWSSLTSFENPWADLDLGASQRAEVAYLQRLQQERGNSFTIEEVDVDEFFHSLDPALSNIGGNLLEDTGVNEWSSILQVMSTAAPWFQSLDPLPRMELAKQFRKRRLQEGEFLDLDQEGEYPPLCVVLSGALGQYKDSQDAASYRDILEGTGSKWSSYAPRSPSQSPSVRDPEEAAEAPDAYLKLLRLREDERSLAKGLLKPLDAPLALQLRLFALRQKMAQLEEQLGPELALLDRPAASPPVACASPRAPSTIGTSSPKSTLARSARSTGRVKSGHYGTGSVKAIEPSEDGDYSEATWDDDHTVAPSMAVAVVPADGLSEGLSEVDHCDAELLEGDACGSWTTANPEDILARSRAPTQTHSNMVYCAHTTCILLVLPRCAYDKAMKRSAQLKELERIRFLQAWFPPKVPLENLRRVAGSFVEETRTKGAVLAREGYQAPSVWLIVSGSCRCVVGWANQGSSAANYASNAGPGGDAGVPGNMAVPSSPTFGGNADKGGLQLANLPPPDKITSPSVSGNMGLAGAANNGGGGNGNAASGIAGSNSANGPGAHPATLHHSGTSGGQESQAHSTSFAAGCVGQTLGTVEAGQFLGLWSVLFRRPETATIVVSSPEIKLLRLRAAQCTRLPAEVLDPLMELARSTQNWYAARTTSMASMPQRLAERMERVKLEVQSSQIPTLADSAFLQRSDEQHSRAPCLEAVRRQFGADVHPEAEWIASPRSRVFFNSLVLSSKLAGSGSIGGSASKPATAPAPHSARAVRPRGRNLNRGMSDVGESSALPRLSFASPGREADPAQEPPSSRASKRFKKFLQISQNVHDCARQAVLGSEPLGTPRVPVPGTSQAKASTTFQVPLPYPLKGVKDSFGPQPPQQQQQQQQAQSPQHRQLSSQYPGGSHRSRPRSNAVNSSLSVGQKVSSTSSALAAMSTTATTKSSTTLSFAAKSVAKRLPVVTEAESEALTQVPAQPSRTYRRTSAVVDEKTRRAQLSALTAASQQNAGSPRLPVAGLGGFKSRARQQQQAAKAAQRARLPSANQSLQQQQMQQQQYQENNFLRPPEGSRHGRRPQPKRTGTPANQRNSKGSDTSTRVAFRHTGPLDTILIGSPDEEDSRATEEEEEEESDSNGRRRDEEVEDEEEEGEEDRSRSDKDDALVSDGAERERRGEALTIESSLGSESDVDIGALPHGKRSPANRPPGKEEEEWHGTIQSEVAFDEGAAAMEPLTSKKNSIISHELLGADSEEISARLSSVAQPTPSMF